MDRSYLIRLSSSLISAVLIAHILIAYVYVPGTLSVKAEVIDWSNNSQTRVTASVAAIGETIKNIPTVFSQQTFSPPSLPPPVSYPPDFDGSASSYQSPKNPGQPYIPNNPTPTSTGGYNPTPTTEQSNPSVPTVAPTQIMIQPTATPSLPPSGGGSSPSSQAQQIFDLINGERGRQGFGTLSFDDRLNRAAQKYADVIGPAHQCKHDYGSAPIDRFRAEGYLGYGGENITCGIASPQVAFNAWMNSQGHKDNMLNPHYNVAGLGYLSGYWVLDLGDRY